MKIVLFDVCTLMKKNKTLTQYQPQIELKGPKLMYAIHAYVHCSTCTHNRFVVGNETHRLCTCGVDCRIKGIQSHGGAIVGKMNQFV